MPIPQPNAGVIPYFIFDIVMPLCRSEAENRVILFIARNTRGYGKDEDWISKGQMVRGKINRKTGEIICLGTGLSYPSVNKGIHEAIEDGWIAERILCPSCHNEVTRKETETIQLREGKEISRQVVPSNCPHCSNALRGKEQFWYRLNWSDDPNYTVNDAIADLLKQEGGIKERLIGVLKSLEYPYEKIFSGGIKNSLITEEIDKTESTEEKDKSGARAKKQTTPPSKKPEPEPEDNSLFSAEADAAREQWRAGLDRRPADMLDAYRDEGIAQDVLTCWEHFCNLFNLSPPERKKDAEDWKKGAIDILNLFQGDVKAAMHGMDVVAEKWRNEEITHSIYRPESIFQDLKAVRDRGEGVKRKRTLVVEKPDGTTEKITIS